MTVGYWHPLCRKHQRHRQDFLCKDFERSQQQNISFPALFSLVAEESGASERRNDQPQTRYHRISTPINCDPESCPARFTLWRCHCWACVICTTLDCIPTAPRSFCRVPQEDKDIRATTTKIGGAAKKLTSRVALHVPNCAESDFFVLPSCLHLCVKLGGTTTCTLL